MRVIRCVRIEFEIKFMKITLLMPKFEYVVAQCPNKYLKNNLR